jgi:D-alanyl-lipoteichoic acid acyltransferase DltB (MBOAT superfamily)
MFLLYYAVTAKNIHWSNKTAQIMLLAASLFFYACWNPAYILLILLSVLVTWLSGILMETKTQSQKQAILAGSLIINLGILFFFKYYNFFADQLGRVISFNIPNFNILLPVGISFYTFQALGYSIDVYRGTVKAERNFINYALFVTFFPALVAGPIERTANLLPQFKINNSLDYDKVTSGLKLAAWGMFKKVVIADRLAVYVNAVYHNPAVYPACSIALATFFFAFQIYCDFSGYSDIAIGSARALGFNLMTNFRQPYFARSIADFWRRWHISLTTWLTDYIYIPLGGNRRGLFRQCVNIMIVFALSGLWHGAAWNFVAWGTLHGLFQVIERLIRNHKERNIKTARPQRKHIIIPLIQVFITFILVCFAWIFFRANSLKSAAIICSKLSTLPSELAGYIQNGAQAGIIGTVRQMFQLGNIGQGVFNEIVGFGIKNTLFSLFVITILIFGDLILQIKSTTGINIRFPIIIRWAGYYILIITIILSWPLETPDFIYFTF